MSKKQSSNGFFKLLARGLMGGGGIVFFTAPLWSKFVESWIDQNDLFQDPNALISSIISPVIAILTSSIFSHTVAAAFGCALTIFLLWIVANNSHEEGIDSEERNKRQRLNDLNQIMTIVYEILSESDEGYNLYGYEREVAPAFKQQAGRLNSLNVTLEKAGFRTVNFRDYSHQERNLLAEISSTVGALANDGHLDEAYEEARRMFGSANLRLGR